MSKGSATSKVAVFSLFLFGMLACIGICLADSTRADSTRAFHLAARSGDLDEVRRLIESGVPVDANDAWGNTPLKLAAAQGQVEVVRYLLDNGADLNARETFFGESVLGGALRKGALEVAKILLDAGAEDRAVALAHALKNGNIALARTAATSGSIIESEAAGLRARFPALEGELGKILASIETRPDPPPPEYSTEQLADFAGRFESRDGPAADIEIRDGALILAMDGQQTALEAVAERTFKPLKEADGSERAPDLTVRFFGRAGTVEGLRLQRSGQQPIAMWAADAPVAVPAEAGERNNVPGASESVADSGSEPTVHWPAFRGANRGGIGDGTEMPVDFDLETGDGVAWRAEVGGLGNSSPVVWGDKIFVTTAVAEGGSVPLRVGRTGAGDEVEEDKEHRWLVIAYHKADGRRLWQTEVGRGVPLTKRHFKATQANSSPATDGRHVVVVFPTAGLACLSTGGEIQWKHELGGLNAGGFNDPGVEWGFAASPIIYQGKVILQVDIHEGPHLAAWDLETGRPLWRTERPDVAPSWATPAIWTTPGGDELVVNASIIRGYDPSDGRELWSLGPTSIQVVASPVVGPRRLYVSSGYPPAKPIYAVRPGIRGDHTIDDDGSSVSPEGGKRNTLAWHHTRGGAYMPTPLLYRGLLYIVHHSARIVAHDARSGQPVYKARFSAGGTMTASPVAGGGKIYQGTEQGSLYVLAAGPEYRELAVHEIGAPLMATPAISEGLLLIRTPSELIALGTAKTTHGTSGSPP